MCQGANNEEQTIDADVADAPAARLTPHQSTETTRGSIVCEQKTGELFCELRETDDIGAFLRRYDLQGVSLSSYLNAKLEEKGLKRSEVLRKAQIEQTFGWYVFKGQRGMGRNNVIKLCLVMELDASETNRALQAAGASLLYPKLRYDAIIIWCLEHRVGLQRANEVLYAFDEDCLE